MGKGIKQGGSGLKTAPAKQKAVNSRCPSSSANKHSECTHQRVAEGRECKKSQGLNCVLPARRTQNTGESRFYEVTVTNMLTN